MITAVFSGSSTKPTPARYREEEKGKILFYIIVQRKLVTKRIARLSDKTTETDKEELFECCVHIRRLE